MKIKKQHNGVRYIKAGKKTVKIKKYNGVWHIEAGKKLYRFRSIRSRYWRAREDFPQWLDRQLYEAIYYTCWSRDCDMCESTNTGVVYGEKNWEKMMDHTGEWAEGPVSYDRISKEEYKEFENPGIRDRVMEAFENGNSSSIYV